MLRKLSMIFAAAVLLPLAVHSQTVDEVIAKNIQAHGGMEKLKAIQTLRYSGKMDMGSIQAAVMEEVKRPGKVREEFIVQRMAMVQAYDSGSGWQINPFGGRRDPEKLSDDDSKSLQIDADIDGPLVDYKEKGHTAELVGHDSVEGTDCYKIKLTLKNGDVRYYYLDTDSYLELKVESQTTVRGTIRETETYYGDYEEVNGVYYPFAYEIGQKGDTFRVKYTIDKIEQNVSLDDSLFTEPAVKAKPAGQ